MELPGKPLTCLPRPHPPGVNAANTWICFAATQMGTLVARYDDHDGVFSLHGSPEKDT